MLRLVPVVGRVVCRPSRALSTRLAEAEGHSAASGEVADHAFVGLRSTVLTHKLKIHDPVDYPIFPVYRILNPDGSLCEGAELPDISKETWLEMYRRMVELQGVDTVFYNSQRQGRISFYMQCHGEEAECIGSAAAMDPEDTMLAQYRELGIFLWRGVSIQQIADQLFSNKDDPGKGRQMPMHIGLKNVNIQTISSPLATQLPQATGAAYANKLTGNNKAIICYFGEGAASEGDFHAALNFAATLECPVIFFCRNNGYAISTPTKDQYRGDGILSRAIGYGMHAIRVDGNDLAAVYIATQEARKLAVEQNRPVMIEAMSYRQGHHSTSDDSTRYRKVEEIEHHKETSDPVNRVHAFLMNQGWWNDDQEKALRKEVRKEVLKALETGEAKGPPPLTEVFADVYDQLPRHLQRQQAEMYAHLEKYPEK